MSTEPRAVEQSPATFFTTVVRDTYDSLRPGSSTESLHGLSHNTQVAGPEVPQHVHNHAKRSLDAFIFTSFLRDTLDSTMDARVHSQARKAQQAQARKFLNMSTEPRTVRHAFTAVSLDTLALVPKDPHDLQAHDPAVNRNFDGRMHSLAGPEVPQHVHRTKCGVADVRCSFYTAVLRGTVESIRTASPTPSLNARPRRPGSSSACPRTQCVVAVVRGIAFSSQFYNAADLTASVPEVPRHVLSGSRATLHFAEEPRDVMLESLRPEVPQHFQRASGMAAARFAFSAFCEAGSRNSFPRKRCQEMLQVC